MFKNINKLGVAILILTCHSYFANAEKTHDGWDVKVNGYVELDNNYDSTRSFTEQLNAGPVAKTGTVAGDNGRTQMSARATRLYLKMALPEDSGWKTKGWVESDFQGYDPAPQGPTGGAQSEASFFTAPTFRLRNAYVTTEKNGWTILAGQNWSTFGYQPFYEILNTSNETPINLIQRNPQVKVTKAIGISDSLDSQVDVALSRPTQRDSDIPNLDLGARVFWNTRKAGLLHWIGNDFHLEPTSIAVSGTYRQFSTPNSDGNTADKQSYAGGAVAVSAIVPILTSSDEKNMGNSLTFLGEFVNGSGIADNYSGFSGGLSSLTNATGAVSNGVANTLYPNLDGGLAGYDTSGNFQLVQTQEFTAELQYILPTETTMAVNVAYGRLHSPNVLNLTASTAGTYDYSELYSADFVYDFTTNIRAIAEYSKILTHYADNSYPANNRYGVSVFFMF